jgi:hypothetical protein
MNTLNTICTILVIIASLATIFPVKRRKAALDFIIEKRPVVAQFIEIQEVKKISNVLVFLACTGIMILAFMSGLLVLISQNFSQHGIYASFGLFIVIALYSLFFFKSSYQKIV